MLKKAQLRPRHQYQRMICPFKDGSYWFDFGYCCGGVEIKNGILVEAPPILRKHINKPFTVLLRKVKNYELVYQDNSH